MPSRSSRRMGVVGFLPGAYWAMWLAEQGNIPVTARVASYGIRPGSYARTSSAFRSHLAEADEFVRPSAIRNLRKSLAALDSDVGIHAHAGTHHWFFERDRPDAFDAAASRRA
ncbi:MAG: dienelactone hydrolase family protein [Chloroflexi bacterium]|nr:dienelactone hydrolase family protein [Chloroflexota bacterium]